MNWGIALIVAIVALYWLSKLYKWAEYKNKYPILSAEPPAGIMEVGDIVYLEQYKYEYLGNSNTDGLWYIFMPENSITPYYVDRSDTIKRVDAIYGRYGIKWKRIK